MRILLFIVLLTFINPLFAQRDEVKTTVSEDKFEGTKSVNTEYWQNLGKDNRGNTISGMLSKNNAIDIIYLNIVFVGDLGCLVQNSSTMSVKLSNDEIVEFTQISNTNCKGVSDAIFVPLTKNELMLSPDIYTEIAIDNVEQLKKHEWTIIRLSGSEYYTNIEPNPTRRIKNPEQFFIKHLEAIENNEIFKKTE